MSQIFWANTKVIFSMKEDVFPQKKKTNYFIAMCLNWIKSINT